MEHHRISKLLNNSAVPKLVTRKWIEVSQQNSLNRNARFKAPKIRSDLCDYSNAGTIHCLAASANEDDKAEKDTAFKINFPFRSCI